MKIFQTIGAERRRACLLDMRLALIGLSVQFFPRRLLLGHKAAHRASINRPELEHALSEFVAGWCCNSESKNQNEGHGVNLYRRRRGDSIEVSNTHICIRSSAYIQTVLHSFEVPAYFMTTLHRKPSYSNQIFHTDISSAFGDKSPIVTRSPKTQERRM
jgi:hypothetical protein